MPVIEILEGAHKAKILVSERDATHLKKGDRLYIPVALGGDPPSVQYRFTYIEDILW